VPFQFSLRRYSVGRSAGASFRELASALDFIARQIGPGVDLNRPPGGAVHKLNPVVARSFERAWFQPLEHVLVL
jgi:hypothetical protein